MSSVSPSNSSNNINLRNRKQSKNNEGNDNDNTTITKKNAMIEELQPNNATTTIPLLASSKKENNNDTTTAGMVMDPNDKTNHASFHIIPLIQRPLLFRLDVGPFLIMYIILFLCDTLMMTTNDSLNDSFVIVLSHQMTKMNVTTSITFVYIGTLLSHLALVLLTQWNINMKAMVGYTKCRYYSSRIRSSSSFISIVNKWTHCLVQHPSESNNNATIAGIVPIQQTSNKQKDYDDEDVNYSNSTKVINFQDRVFRCCIDDDVDDMDVTLWSMSKSTKEQSQQQQKQCNNMIQFRPLRYPIDLPLHFYSQWTGHASMQSALLANEIYGLNRTILQLPSFVSLLGEQLVAPFFLFQIFCVILWSLDEYWYYALFTLGALIMFESTVAYTRRMNVQRLHTIGHKNKYQKIWVRRGMNNNNNNNVITGTASESTRTKNKMQSATAFQWMSIYVSELLPGDWVSLSGNNVPVPADILLMNGTAVCDEALLTGESVPQLKQPLDVVSSSSNAAVCLDIHGSEYKESILFGGTMLVVGTSSVDDELTTTSTNATTTKANNGNKKVLLSPDEGIEGIVLTTGFETAQGNLLRTMAHTSKSADSVHTVDTFVFIFCLILCAVMAAGYVLYESWHDEKRNRFRLFLHVIIIVTSVVPPELPMELSLAVTNSVAALMKRCKVYCTEHFRIPWAGEVDVCCFDKTGTLTSDEMLLKGIRVYDEKDIASATVATKQKGEESDTMMLHPTEDDIPWSARRVMAACHSLALAVTTTTNKKNGKTIKKTIVVGDPLEQTVLRESGYQLIGNNTVVAVTLDGDEMNGGSHDDHTTDSINSRKPITILHRFTFSSKLKRMTTLVTEEGGQGTVIALTKGAPETIKTLLKASSIPSNFDNVSYYHMSKGRRVLAMAYRNVGTVQTLQQLKLSGRTIIENDLMFAGFLILECPLKSDSKSVISELKKSRHKVVMITGDAILTAAEVAKQVGIVETIKTNAVYKLQPIHQLQNCSFDDDSFEDALSFFEYVPLTSSQENPIKPVRLSQKNLISMKELVDSHDASFCISGDVLVDIAMKAMRPQKLLQQQQQLTLFDEKNILLSHESLNLLKRIVPVISVFARHAPHQKESVIAAFNHAGFQTLMCGDGTNDVGALKRAHVGISLISAPDVESKQREANKKLAKAKSDHKREQKGGIKKPKKVSKTPKYSMIEESLRQLREANDELDHVELGDASVAAPFTSRAVSIKCCKDVIQQGRCTLVTMLQIYKILGINCLVNALVLSRLFLYGVKQGDRQITILGLVVAALFFFVTRAEPLSTLSTTRPPASVLCTHALLSIVGQFVVHLIIILLTTHYALLFIDPYDPSLVLDGPFNPNVLNSCTFLLTCLATVNTFGVNYRGRPFMQDLQENKMLYRSLQVCYVILAICALEVFPPLGDLLQMSTLPSIDEMDVGFRDKLPTFLQVVDFNIFLFLLMVADTVAAFFVEHQIRRRFDGKV